MTIEVELRGLTELQEHLQRVKEALEAAPRAVVEASARAVSERMRQEAPKRTGALARGIGYRVSGLGRVAEAHFTDDQAYTPFVIEGTRAHEILPRQKRALFWVGAGHPVVFVHHPGTRPDDFPGRALDRAEREVDAALDQIGDAIVEGRPLRP
jgi:hypothetical protein